MNFSVSSLPLDPEEDELRVHRRQVANAAAEQATTAAAAVAEIAAAASETEETHTEQQQRQEKQQMLLAARKERDFLVDRLQQQTPADELRLQHQQQQHHIGTNPIYRILVPTPGAFITDNTWTLQLKW